MTLPGRECTVLGYKLKLYPTRNKGETLAAMCVLFKRIHSEHLVALGAAGKAKFGSGRFTSWTQRRAFADWRKTKKANAVKRRDADRELTIALRRLPYIRREKSQQRALKVIDKTIDTVLEMRSREELYGRPFKLPFLKAELMDVAQVGEARKAKGFDYWVSVSAPQEMGKGHTLFLPAKGHIALNRTLAYPGAKLSESAEVFRKKNSWYARVSVSVPIAQAQAVTTWIGCDVGARKAVTCSDGYKGPDLRPFLNRARERRCMQQKHGIRETRDMSPQRQVLAHEARRIVSVARRTGRGVALEDPNRLIRWKQHAARFLGERVLLLSALQGGAAQVVGPQYTSSTCSRCGHVELRQRHREMFRCWRCGFTHNADINASRVIAKRAPTVLVGLKPLVSASVRTPEEPRGDNPLPGELIGAKSGLEQLIGAAKEIEPRAAMVCSPARIEAVPKTSETIPTKKRRTSAPKADARKGVAKRARKQEIVEGGGAPMISSGMGLQQRASLVGGQRTMGAPMISSGMGLQQCASLVGGQRTMGAPMISSGMGLQHE